VTKFAAPNRVHAALLGLWLLALASPAAAQFKEAPAGGFPPASGQIAFIREQNLWLMNSDGSNPHELLATGRVANKIAWSPDNATLLFCQSGVQAYQLPEGGGGTVKLYDIFSIDVADPTRVVQLTKDALSNTPDLFPDGTRMAFTRNLHAFDIHKEVPNFQVFVGAVAPESPAKPLNQGKLTTALQLLTPAVSPDGQTIACVVTNEAQVLTVKQSLGIAIFPAAGFTGTASEWIRKAEEIPEGYAPSWSPDGRLIAYVDMSPGVRSLSIYDTNSKTRKVIFTPAANAGLATSAPSWSPDGNWIVFSDANRNITVVDRNGRSARQLTSGGTDINPTFSH
jgi:Tol biopolymer transport system component